MMELEGECENNHFKHESKSLVYGLWARLLVHRDDKTSARLYADPVFQYLCAPN